MGVDVVQGWPRVDPGLVTVSAMELRTVPLDFTDTVSVTMFLLFVTTTPYFSCATEDPLTHAGSVSCLNARASGRLKHYSDSEPQVISHSTLRYVRAIYTYIYIQTCMNIYMAVENRASSA